MLLQDLLLYQNSVLSLERVKRIDTVFLLAQEVVTSGHGMLYKKPTADMLAASRSLYKATGSPKDVDAFVTNRIQLCGRKTPFSFRHLRGLSQYK